MLKKTKAKKDVYNFWCQRPDKLVTTIKSFAHYTNDKYESTLASILK